MGAFHLTAAAGEFTLMSALIRMSNSEEETERIAVQLARRLVPGSVVALEGDLGAGKTRFVRGLARGLGLDPDAISSPTFVLEHRHSAEGAVGLVHIDAYRIHSADDLASIGWEELLAEGASVVAVEWASRIGPALPPFRTEVRLRHRGEELREIEIEDVRPATLPTACAVCGAPLKPEGLDARVATETTDARSPGTAAGAAVGSAAGAGAGAARASGERFCSPRCRMSDLGRWFRGDYRVSRAIEEQDLNSGPDSSWGDPRRGD